MRICLEHHVIRSTRASFTPSRNKHSMDGIKAMIHTRKNEESSTIKIVKIEPDVTIVRLIHISILGMRNKSHTYLNGIVEKALHIPMAEVELHHSTTRLKNDRCDLPDYESGYVRWKTVNDQEQSSCFNIPVNEVIHFLEQSANRPSPTRHSHLFFCY